MAWNPELQAIKNAMHVHSSFSEMTASMVLQLDQASQWGIDNLWWTEHGWRMDMTGYRQFIGFASNPDIENGHALHFLLEPPQGRLSQSGGGVVKTAASPLDPAGGALRVHAKGATRATASRSVLFSNGTTLNASRLMIPYRGSIARVTFTLELIPTALNSGSYLELVIDLSDQPAPGGQLQYQLVYRFATKAAGPTASGGRGVITIPVVPGQRATVNLNPVADISTLWPSMQAADNSLYDISFGAVSVRGGLCDGKLESLRFNWLSAEESHQIQRDLIASYGPRYPAVQQFAASELSLLNPHINRFADNPAIQDADTGQTAGDYYPGAIAAIHQSGGAASWNHPYGSNHASIPTDPQLQAARRRQVFQSMLGVNCYGVDALEVAYYSRGGANMQMHLDLWDALSRQLLLLTGSGANDDHTAQPWGQLQNGYHTVSLGTDGSEQSVVSALKSGRALFGHTGLAPQTVLDLALDDGAVMGQVSVTSAVDRTLTVFAGGLPAGCGVRVVQGLVDYSGVDPVTQTLTTLSADELGSGSTNVSFSAGSGTFLRTEVISANGVVVAGSNPVYALTAPPPDTVTVAPERRYNW